MSEYEMCSNEGCGKPRKTCTCDRFKPFVIEDFKRCFFHKREFDSNGNCPECTLKFEQRDKVQYQLVTKLAQRLQEARI